MHYRRGHYLPLPQLVICINFSAESQTPIPNYRDRRAKGNNVNQSIRHVDVPSGVAYLGLGRCTY